ncbi:MAG: hypothetical protein QMC89_02640 [Candidatus Hodarchaeaceae archaeon]|nr:hypothetical protein [Candidatus Hodarchaeaceae archaeon]
MATEKPRTARNAAASESALATASLLTRRSEPPPCFLVGVLKEVASVKPRLNSARNLGSSQRPVGRPQFIIGGGRMLEGERMEGEEGIIKKIAETLSGFKEVELGFEFMNVVG